MKKVSFLLLAVSAASLGVLSSASRSIAAPHIELKTAPKIEQVKPNDEPVTISLQAQDDAGKPLSRVNFRVQLLTPASNPWLTSDFPIVEGTKLLELNTSSANGFLSFQQVMPIRGDYQLKVTATPQQTGAFAPIDRTLRVAVPEKTSRLTNAAILALVLLLAGASSGWIIGTGQQVKEGEIVSQRVRLLLSGGMLTAIIALLVLNVSAEKASSHGDEHSTAQSLPTQQNADVKVKLSGDTIATVGKATQQTVQVWDAKTNQPLSDAVLNVQAIALEHNETVFAMAAAPGKDGKFAWQQQFFDGAPHQLVVEVKPAPKSTRQFQPLKVTQAVSVEAVQPPLDRRFISLGYFTGCFALGLVGGLAVSRRAMQTV